MRIKPEVTVAIIAGIVAIVVACIQFCPSKPKPHPLIFGRIVNITDEPITNASVFIVGTPINTTTDSNGEFKFELADFAENNIRLRIVHPDYKTRESTYSINGDIKIILESTQNK